ncbi:hypothetical protein LENED_003982 [Lentinula edodes]|uniref:Uncharacterized protein n=1 Tax=Lentinula edodes TaxID=5353 RepID=A0A1Q3E507_LENED|nr:hypothetical protein LENED_003982 [Lentinula edodes]
MMEVDMQSPSSSLRPAYGSTKRARSPDETNSPSRPSKRLTLATEIEYNPSQPIYLRSSSSAGSSRQPSEDWVQQAGSLTIDSPLCTGASGGLPFEDYAMAADQPVQNPSTAVPLTATYGRPQLPPLQTSFSRPSDHLAPSINVLPPTPNVPFPMAFSLAARPSTPMNESPMSIPNSPSSATILSPSRKHRFAMGPRADCEKSFAPHIVSYI